MKWFTSVLAGLAGIFVAAAVLATSTMSIQVRDAAVRATPSSLGKVVGHYRYADPVVVIETKGNWRKITGKGPEGWVHESALSSKPLAMKQGSDQVGQYASADELALAGKGFSKEVEGQFRADNPDLDFRWVDRMESFRVSPAQVQRFLKDGSVTPEGGAQ